MFRKLLFGNKKRNRAILSALPPAVAVRGIAAVSYAWREPELRLLGGLIDPDRTMVDVGANRGIYAWLGSRYTDVVYAYEPIPMLADALRRARLRRVEVREVALSDHAGEQILRIPHLHDVALDTRASLEPIEGQVDEISVRVARLDDEDVGDVGFIKIDVEGHEATVLKGAEGLLDRCRPNLLVEIEQRFYEDDIERIFEWLESRGYRGYFVHEGTTSPLRRFQKARHQLNYLPDVLHPDYVNNFIFRHVSKV